MHKSKYDDVLNNVLNDTSCCETVGVALMILLCTCLCLWGVFMFYEFLMMDKHHVVWVNSCNSSVLVTRSNLQDCVSVRSF